MRRDLRVNEYTAFPPGPTSSALVAVYAINVKVASILRSLPDALGLRAQRCRVPIARFAKLSRSAITVIM